MVTKFKSPIRKAMHELADDLRLVGAIDRKTMRHYDGFCLTPVPDVSASEIKALRDRENVSQSAFAVHLGVSSGLVSKWERGERKPSGPSLKLLDIVQRKGLDFLV